MAIGLLSSRDTFAAEGIDGFTEPYQDIDVTAAEMGSIIRIDVKEGDRVKTSQLLAQLDDEVLRASLDIAKANMEFQGRLESSIAEFDLQNDLLVKLNDLLARKHATPQEVERTLSQKNIAEARVKAIREELAVKSLEYNRILSELKRRKIFSPIEGIVTRIYKDPGEFVSPSDPMVLKVVRLDPLLVIFSVPAEMANTMQVDQAVKVQVAKDKQVVEGIVEFVSPTIDPQSGSTRVRVRIPNPSETIPSGTKAQLVVSGEPGKLANRIR
jgi:RND family efflux transporter MFP subunit